MKEVFAENLRRLRTAKAMTQEQAAEQLGVSAQSISRWECGTTYPDVLLLPEIARLYSVTVDDLYRKQSVVYDNYAQKLASVYEATKEPADFLRADEEFRKLMAGECCTAEDVRTYGCMHHMMAKYCIGKTETLLNDVIAGVYPGAQETVWRAKHQKIGFLRMIGREKEALDAQRKNVEAGSREARDWVLLMEACRGVGNLEEACVWFRKASALFPNDALVWSTGGDIHYTLKQYEEAMRCWDCALERDSNLYDAKYAKGFCYEELGEYRKAYAMWCEIADSLKRDGYEAEVEFPQELARKCKDKM